MKKILSAILFLLMFIPITAYANDYYSDGSASVPITVSIAGTTGDYSLAVPAVLDLIWVEQNSDYEGTYTLSLKGSFDETDEIEIKPSASTFTMTSETGKTTSAQITQERTTFAGSEINEETYTNITQGLVKATFPTYELYEGGVSFSFKRTER